MAKCSSTTWITLAALSTPNPNWRPSLMSCATTCLGTRTLRIPLLHSARTGLMRCADASCATSMRTQQIGSWCSHALQQGRCSLLGRPSLGVGAPCSGTSGPTITVCWASESTPSSMAVPSRQWMSRLWMSGWLLLLLLLMTTTTPQQRAARRAPPTACLASLLKTTTLVSSSPWTGRKLSSRGARSSTSGWCLWTQLPLCPLSPWTCRSWMQTLWTSPSTSYLVIPLDLVPY
mmetsp:Transcript_19003/g.53202  ORF Transcript_19003/g.53202 Transcript_19003/m.53202 type:complete len:233 (+) Transcript_19003:1080-1778(+)